LPGLALQQGFEWRDIHPNPTNLFKLFWFMAQKTQYYATGGRNLTGGTVLDRPGDAGRYIKLYGTADGKPFQFQPSLWEIAGKVPVGVPADVDSKRMAMTDALIPHALRAVASLYRLFWFETHLDEHAQQDIPHRAQCEARFGAAMPIQSANSFVRLTLVSSLP
jgi:hypothetical protein